jgi:cholesterol oxidase
LLGVRIDDPQADYTQGVAITSSWHPDEATHIEPVRYGKGSNAMGLLNTIMTDGGTRRQRWTQFVRTLVKRPSAARLLIPRRWSERVIILLVMQTLNNSITVLRKRSIFGSRLTSKQGDGESNPTGLPPRLARPLRMEDLDDPPWCRPLLRPVRARTALQRHR